MTQIAALTSLAADRLNIAREKNIIYLVSSVNNFYKIIYLLCELLETRYSVALTPLAAERFNMADKKIIFLSLPLSYLIFAEDPV